MKYKHIFIISPAFYSHFNPLLVLAKSFKELGVQVTFGSSKEFEEQVLKEDLNFYEIDISKNKNTGKAEATVQDDSEKERLEEFFESTRKGAIETLITQSNHRKADMLYDPHELIENIKKIDDELNIDLFVVDILSYSVSLSLYFLNLDFITFCPPHPNTIPDEISYYGVPENWPSAIDIEDDKLSKLRKISKSTEKEFTDIFNKIISENKDLEKIDNAFKLVSNIASIYNYFDFYKREDIGGKRKKIFIGNCFEKEELDEKWLERIDFEEKKIMISLGTFLSNRKDVLEKLIKGVKAIYPKAIIIVSAGSNAENLKSYRSKNVIIEEFIPQKALMPYIDIVVFHAGCNTLTEAMYYGNKMIVLPFSSDQFNIAYDIEKNRLGEVLDPNHFTRWDLEKAFENIEKSSRENLNYWKKISRERGADYAAKIILEI